MIEEWLFEKTWWSKTPLHTKYFPFFSIFQGKLLLYLIIYLLTIFTLIFIVHTIHPENNLLNYWPLNVLFYLSIFFLIITTINTYIGVRRGVTWFNTEEHKEFDIKWQDINQRLDSPFKIYKLFYNGGINLEKEMAVIASKNYIEKFKIRNNKTTNPVEVTIDIDWSSPDASNSTLYLYRDEGEMQMNVTDIRSRNTAVRLDFHKQGERIHFPDTKVVLGKTYNYYTWIEVEIYSGLLVRYFKKQPHVVKLAETFEAYTDRFAKIMQTKDKLKALKAPKTTNKSKSERIKDEIKKRASAKTSKKERWKDIDDYIDNLDLTDEEKEDVLAESLDIIRKIEDEPDNPKDGVEKIFTHSNNKSEEAKISRLAKEVEEIFSGLEVKAPKNQPSSEEENIKVVNIEDTTNHRK